MEDLKLRKTQYLPEVDFSASTGLLSIKGRSISENPLPFYEVIIHWLNDYFVKPQPKTTLSFYIEYANSGTAKMLYNIIEALESFSKRGYNCEVIWYFEEDDESIEDLGEYLKSSFSIPVSIVCMFD
jgi:hypothetical protein